MVKTTFDQQGQTKTPWNLNANDCDSDLRGHRPLCD